MSGNEFARYGGSTTCIVVARGSTVASFIDAGTGVMAFEAHGLQLTGSIPVFVTHYHWDHIQGVSMLGEVWTGACSFTFHGPGDPREMLTDAIKPPWFPVSLQDAPEPVAYRPVDQPVEFGEIVVTAFPVQHPQGAVGYRIDGPNASVAIVTDHESTPESDTVIADAIAGVDVVFHDAQYLPSEAADHVGWGHSTWKDAVAMAERVGARQLVLTSHDPRRTDEEVDEMIVEAREVFPNTVAAGPDLELPL